MGLTEKYNRGRYWLLLHWEVGQDQPWYLVSDQPGQADLLKIYGRRMWVEEMYSDMRGHGFDLEVSQLKPADHIGPLFLDFGIVLSG